MSPLGGLPEVGDGIVFIAIISLEASRPAAHASRLLRMPIASARRSGAATAFAAPLPSSP
jgi:hypothetical protein